jgi:enoyl-CoA hydratase/carnithine racemase
MKVSQTEYETIVVAVDEGVATVTLNRPDKHNAMNLKMQKEFFGEMWRLEKDESVRAIVVTGAGRGFCSGVDLGDEGDAFSRDAHERHDAELGVDSDSISERAAFWMMKTPTIGAINGTAIGAGLTLALLFDIRIAADDAKLSLPFTRLGIIPDANSTWLLPRLTGLQRALELMLSGRRFTGAEAADWGIVTQAVPRDEVLGAAQALALDIAKNTSPASVALTKRLIHEGLGQSDRLASMQRETRIVWWLGEQGDAEEGVRAMMERRAPQWKLSKHIELPSDLE